MEVTDNKDKEYDEKVKDQLKEAGKTSAFSRLIAMSEPKINILIGILSSLCHGAIMPTFAIILSKILFTLTLYPELKDNPLYPNLKAEDRRKSDEYCLYMTICAAVGLVTMVIMKYSFGVIGETVTLRIRQ